ncbi:MAG: nitroreductase family protein [Pseudonocardia sp.]
MSIDLLAVAPDLVALLRDRRSRPTLGAPAPNPSELHELLVAACSAPDHGRLRPWRFVVVDGAGRESLGEAFAAAQAERNPSANAVKLARHRAQPLRAPMIVVVVGTPREHPKVPVWEQRAAVACVAYGLLLAAHARGFGAMWRTGWYGDDPKVRAHLGVTGGEEVTGWIYLGTPTGSVPAPRAAVEPSVTWLR